MPLSDSYKKHGTVTGKYNPQTVIKAAQAVLDILQQGGERRVVALHVAALLILMHAKLANDTVDNTIELIRQFMVNWEQPNAPSA